MCVCMQIRMRMYVWIYVNVRMCVMYLCLSVRCMTMYDKCLQLAKWKCKTSLAREFLQCKTLWFLVPFVQGFALQPGFWRNLPHSAVEKLASHWLFCKLFCKSCLALAALHFFWKSLRPWRFVSHKALRVVRYEKIWQINCLINGLNTYDIDR